MINLHERMLPTSAGVEPATSWSPVGRRIQLSHRGRQGGHLGFPMDKNLACFDPEVNLLLQSKFRLKSTKGLGEDVEN